MTVNKLEPSAFYFTVLVAVDGPGELLSFRPAVTDEKAFTSAAAAWVAGAIAPVNTMR